MSVDLHRPRGYMRVAILVLSLALGICLTWYTWHGQVAHPTLLTIAYVALLAILFRARIIEVSKPLQGPTLGVWARLSDLAKGAGCMLAGIGWGLLALGVVPDTPTGVTIVLAPFAVLALAGTFLIIRGLLKNLS
jgi:hypothetical protein